MMDVIDLAGDLRHSIETRNQIPACLALQGDETKDKTLQKGESAGDARIDDRSGGSPLTIETDSRLPDRYHCQPSLFQQGVVGTFFLGFWVLDL